MEKKRNINILNFIFVTFIEISNIINLSRMIRNKVRSNKIKVALLELLR